MQQIYTEKEVLADGLCTQKNSTAHFNKAVNECVHDELRNTLFRILEEEHKIQVEVFNLMHERGFYETPAADPQKMQQIKQKYAKSYQQA